MDTQMDTCSRTEVRPGSFARRGNLSGELLCPVQDEAQPRGTQLFICIPDN